MKQETRGKIVGRDAKTQTVAIKVNDWSVIANTRERQGVTLSINENKITPNQRKKIYALLGEVAAYVDGYRNANTVESAKRFLKKEMGGKPFSLSNCSVQKAAQFCDFIVGFIVQHDIPTMIPLIENCEDIAHYVYACLLKKKCAVCGRTAELHHIDRIGMGNNRYDVHHLGRLVLPLCWKHHSECHNRETEFLQKYHLLGVKLTEELCRLYDLRV